MVSQPAPPEAFAAPPYGYPPQPYPPAPYGYPPQPYPAYAYAPRLPAPTIVVPAGWGAPNVRYAAQRRPPASAWDLVTPEPAPAERFAELEPLAFAAPDPFVAAPSRSSAAQSPPPSPKLDRLQLTGWALLRNGLGNSSLAQGGTLGGKPGRRPADLQVHARHRRLAALQLVGRRRARRGSRRRRALAAAAGGAGGAQPRAAAAARALRRPLRFRRLRRGRALPAAGRARLRSRRLCPGGHGRA